ncbi:uncharacterized protein B0T15DRAFT_138841 [Chaetomium strumarium]|uniref:Uncharacterized protein n=1 Tax=Chaetomium strumarium TaxID=1170767 RepID=A0AAJ0GUN5_9PEZI|nr:hypothetical protein B0T15DRAFT_138841 [Chaetomium strumarium]
MADPTLLWGTRTISVTQPWYTPDLSSPPSFPPFRGPDNDNDNDGDPFQDDPDRDRDRDDDDHAHLSPGVIAAIVVGSVAFCLLVAGLLAYLNYRRRRARKNVEIAMKEEAAMSARAVDYGTTAASSSCCSSGAALADPPPPYDGCHLESQHHHYHHHHHDAEQHQERRWDSVSIATGSAMDDDPDAMGSHATITDGLEPGRHNGGGS